MDPKDIENPQAEADFKAQWAKETCEKFLKHKDKIQWFIDEYFPNLFPDLVILAESGHGNKLAKELSDIWFFLPDSKFNIIENPPGWSAFLEIIED